MNNILVNKKVKISGAYFCKTFPICKRTLPLENIFYNNPHNHPNLFKYLKINGNICYMAIYKREEGEAVS